MNDAICAGEQECQKVKKVKKIDTGVTISPIRRRAPAKHTTKFGVIGRVADVIMCFKFYRNRLRGFRAVRGQIWGLPLTLTVVLTTGQHYLAACDLAHIHRRYVTLWPWPLTPWPWTFVIDMVSWVQTL